MKDKKYAIRVDSVGSNRCVQHLFQQHQEIEQSLNTIESQLEKQGRASHWGDAELKNSKSVAELLGSHLDRHLRKEGELLFPILEAFFPADSGPLAVLRAEHSELRSHFIRMQKAMELISNDRNALSVQGNFQNEARETIRILRDQIYKENRVLLPMIVWLISPEQDADLVQKMEAVDRKPGNVLNYALLMSDSRM